MKDPILLDSERIEEPEPIRAEVVPPSDIHLLITQRRISEGLNDAGAPHRLFLKWGGKVVCYDFSGVGQS